jgi:hypothetical protein
MKVKVVERVRDGMVQWQIDKLNALDLTLYKGAARDNIEVVCQQDAMTLGYIEDFVLEV